MALQTAKGSWSSGDARCLMFGGVISFVGGGGQTVYTAPTGNTGFFITHIIMRAPTGTQPVSISISIGGVTVLSAQSTAAFTATAPILWVPSTATPGVIGTAAGHVIITPVAPAAGAGCTVDVIGYEF